MTKDSHCCVGFTDIKNIDTSNYLINYLFN